MHKYNIEVTIDCRVNQAHLFCGEKKTYNAESSNNSSVAQRKIKEFWWNIDPRIARWPSYSEFLHKQKVLWKTFMVGKPVNLSMRDGDEQMISLRPAWAT